MSKTKKRTDRGGSNRPNAEMFSRYDAALKRIRDGRL